jgi:hypothetical protein
MFTLEFSANQLCEWYYGNFHGVFKTPDDSGDDSSNDEMGSCVISCLSSLDSRSLKRLPMTKQGSGILVEVDSRSKEAKSVHAVADEKDGKRLRTEANMQSAQEQIRLDAVARYQSGALNPTFSNSPAPGESRLAAFCAADYTDMAEDGDNVAPGVLGAADLCLTELTNIGNHDANAFSSDSEDLGKGLSERSDSDAENDTLNASGQEAVELAKVCIEFSTISAEDIWSLFVNSKLRGGMLARSLLIAAKAVQPIECTPWCGSTKLASKTSERKDQRSSFLMWANGEAFVLNWIRLEIYKIVTMKPHTYKHFTPTHLNAPKVGSQSGKLESEQASDDTMARIAHLVCTPESRLILNMLHDSKNRPIIDSKDLSPAALWHDLATMHINNQKWQIAQMNVLQLQEFDAATRKSVSKIDVTQAPVAGLSGECVRESFAKLKKWYGDLAAAAFGKTGVNSTGEDFYGKVWSSYVNGPYLHFPRKEVAMYVFKLWTETNNNDALPKYCIKELHAEAQVRLGVFAHDSKRGFTLPITPRHAQSASSSLLFSPGSHTTSTQSTLQESISSYISFAMKQKSEAPLTPQAAGVVLKPPHPDDAFARLLHQHGLLSVWDSSTSWVFVTLTLTLTFDVFFLRSSTHAFLKQQSIQASMLEQSKISAC